VEAVGGLEDLGGETGSSLMSESSFGGKRDDRSSRRWRGDEVRNLKKSSSSRREMFNIDDDDDDEMWRPSCCADDGVTASRELWRLMTSREWSKCDGVTVDGGDLSKAPDKVKAGFCTAMIWPSRDERTWKWKTRLKRDAQKRHTWH